MALYLYNHSSCIASSKILSAYCVEMSQALTVDYKQYLVPTTVMLTSDLLSVYLAVFNVDHFDLIKVNSQDITLQTGNKVTINNQPIEYLQLHNRVIFIPKLPANLCYTGVDGSVVESKRPLWLKRSDSLKAYDYISITSINYFSEIYVIKEYPNITFVNGLGSGFFNLTSDYSNTVVDFDGQRVGTASSILSTSSLQLDTNFTSSGPSRAFLYHQGDLEFALDNNGSPGSWSRCLTIPTIDTDIPVKFWFKNYKEVTSVLSTTANNSIRIIGTEFLL